VSTTPVVHLEPRITPRIFEKFERAVMVYSGAWGNLFMKKNQELKISWYCPFKQIEAVHDIKTADGNKKILNSEGPGPEKCGPSVRI
jgi:hypothetical protein